MPEKKEFNPILHPIQLISLNVEELYINVKNPPQAEDLSLDRGEFDLRTGHSEYDKEHQIIVVGVKLEIGIKEPKETPFELRVVINGLFKVDETKFQRVNIEDWANRNAPIILYPYVREHAFALTARCGFPGIILPLLEVPVFKLEQPKKPTVKAKVKE